MEYQNQRKGKAMSENKLVFCGHCTYHKWRSCGYMGLDTKHGCTHVENITLDRTPIWEVKIQGDCEKVNANNDCKYFEERNVNDPQ